MSALLALVLSGRREDNLKIMFAEMLADLDVLVLRCRSPRSRTYLAEAVSAYRAGAMRAAIVSCWIAVTLDYIDKLEELETYGDSQAAQEIAEIRRIQRDGDVNAMLAFERGFLATAQSKFELLSPTEKDALERLRNDRNACAHPALDSSLSMFSPPPELARLHILNAVTYLLQHPPVQGTSALDRLKNDVQSPLFPMSTDEAELFLKQGPLGAPRETLVRNFTIANIKHLLSGEIDDDAQIARVAAATNASRRMHRNIFEKTLLEKLGPVLEKAISSKKDREVLCFVTLVPDIWDFLTKATQDLLGRLVGTTKITILVDYLDGLLNNIHLREQALRRIDDLDEDKLDRAISLSLRKEYVGGAVSNYAKSPSFRTAMERARHLILPLIPLMEANDVASLAQVIAENKQIYGSWNVGEVIAGLKGKLSAEDKRVIEEIGPDFKQYLE